MAKKPQKQADVGAELAPRSKYLEEIEMDDDLPLANLDTLDEHALTVYGIRNLNIDMAGQTAAQMRETLANQIGRHRAGFRG